MTHSLNHVVLSACLLFLPFFVLADVQLGTRPYLLVNAMDNGELKDTLLACETDVPKSSRFSMGHRGAPLRFPEHTKESYSAAALMGAGIVECDVTFTKDRELVCRHSQCDLHTTTNILEIPELAAKCRLPGKSGEAKCCTSDITVFEFLQLEGRMDIEGKTSERGTKITHAQSIELFQSLGVQMIPELKSPAVNMPYQEEYSQQDYAQQMLDDYISAGVLAKDVYLQSFNLEDVRYWIDNAPEYGKQAVYLDGRYSKSALKPSMAELKSYGVNYIAPPIWVLIEEPAQGSMVPSSYAIEATAAGLKIMTWTLERSGSLASGGGWYYQSVSNQIDNDGDVYEVLHVLAQEVGVVGVFSDWPATVTHYANCVGGA